MVVGHFPEDVPACALTERSSCLSGASGSPEPENPWWDKYAVCVGHSGLVDHKSSKAFESSVVEYVGTGHGFSDFRKAFAREDTLAELIDIAPSSLSRSARNCCALAKFAESESSVSIPTLIFLAVRDGLSGGATHDFKMESVDVKDSFESSDCESVSGKQESLQVRGSIDSTFGLVAGIGDVCPSERESKETSLIV